MGRTAGTSLALQILSRNLGWDPTEIIGTAYHAPQIGVSDTGPIPNEITYVGQDVPTIERDKTPFNTPDVSRENANRRTNHANPYDAMPGSEETRGRR